MTDAKKRFDKNIDSILVLSSIYDYLKQQVTAFDLSEVLRAEYVLIVSSLDFYIHEIVRNGLLKKFDEQNNDTGLDKVAIPLDIVKVLLNTDGVERKQILNEIIKKILSKDSYQAPQAIEQALGIINIKKIWSELVKNTNESAADVRDKLSLIINERNKIAHESHINFLTGEKEGIDKQTVTDCLDYIKWFVDKVDYLVEKN